jgi:hypothetical protein
MGFDLEPLRQSAILPGVPINAVRGVEALSATCSSVNACFLASA